MDQDFTHVAVTMANVVFTTFRIAAHVPQLIAIVRDPCGARAVSVSSWLMFAMANASNAAYALVIASDWLMFAINLASAASCTLIASIAGCKQRRANAMARQATARAMANAAAAAAPPMPSAWKAEVAGSAPVKRPFSQPKPNRAASVNAMEIGSAMPMRGAKT